MIAGRRKFLAAAASLVLPAIKSTAAVNPTSEVIELRQYTLLRGRRDGLITLFERYFIEPQEAVGAHVLRTFRDLDDPDRFVCFRGFDSLECRRAAQESFYGGLVCKEHRNAANATMIDSDNVLLLRLAAPDSELAEAPDKKEKLRGVSRFHPLPARPQMA